MESGNGTPLLCICTQYDLHPVDFLNLHDTKMLLARTRYLFPSQPMNKFFFQQFWNWLSQYTDKYHDRLSTEFRLQRKREDKKFLQRKMITRFFFYIPMRIGWFHSHRVLHTLCTNTILFI